MGPRSKECTAYCTIYYILTRKGKCKEPHLYTHEGKRQKPQQRKMQRTRYIGQYLKTTLVLWPILYYILGRSTQKSQDRQYAGGGRIRASTLKKYPPVAMPACLDFCCTGGRHHVKLIGTATNQDKGSSAEIVRGFPWTVSHLAFNNEDTYGD